MTFGNTTPLGRLICPTCATSVPPTEGSSAVIAWYACLACGSLWAARIRGGNPTDPIALDVVEGESGTADKA